jgi:regulator of protease activity HflC (stomatin/prohibitin superfamily)
MLFAQSTGLSREDKREAGVIARMMPRAILAIIIIAIGVSCIRVVEPGTVGILERFGYVATDKDGMPLPQAILRPGPHFTLPWLMDEIVTIPTEQLQLTYVGDELHVPAQWKNKIDFKFWTFPGSDPEKDAQNEFITGDSPAVQLLETYIEVRWRVKDPARFYAVLSHSDFYDKSGNETKTLPIFQAIVQECTSFAVTHTFAIHTLNQILITDRAEVEAHCRDILQSKLDSLDNGVIKGSGIEVVSLVIKDLHPPYWHNDIPNEGEREIAGRRVQRGPASAFEFVVSAREYMEQVRNTARGESIRSVNLARGDAEAAIADASVYKIQKIAGAQGDAGRLLAMLHDMNPGNKSFEIDLMQGQLKYAALRDLLDPVNKIIVDPRSINDVSILQPNENGITVTRPPGL